MLHDQRRKLLHQKLQLHYGYKRFRSLQLDACEAVLDGQDTLLILPTGGVHAVHAVPHMREVASSCEPSI